MNVVTCCFYRQCMCCFKDFKNFERMNNLIQVVLHRAIKLIAGLVPKDQESPAKSGSKQQGSKTSINSEGNESVDAKKDEASEGGGKSEKPDLPRRDKTKKERGDSDKKDQENLKQRKPSKDESEKSQKETERVCDKTGGEENNVTKQSRILKCDDEQNPESKDTVEIVKLPKDTSSPHEHSQDSSHEGKYKSDQSQLSKKTRRKTLEEEEEAEEWSLEQKDCLFHIVTKVFMLNLPLYLAYKHCVHATLEELSQQEASALNNYCELAVSSYSIPCKLCIIFISFNFS